MPRIHYEQGFQFRFYASDRTEPPHVHVKKGGGTGKWWIEGAREEWSQGFNLRDRAIVTRIVRDQRQRFLASWSAAFGGAAR